MKNKYCTDRFMRALKGLSLSFIALMSMTACDSDDVGNNLYTKVNENIGEYLISNSDLYSEFIKVLDTTNVMGLLSSYGEYTCFAPDNEAMLAYYQKIGVSGMNMLSMDTLKQIAYDHIILGWTVLSSEFPMEGRLAQITMSDRYISSLRYATGEIYMNRTSLVVTKDIEVQNGVIHRIAETLDPIRDGILEVISQDSTFTLFYAALEETHLADSLLDEEDETYDPELYEDLITTTLDDDSWYYETIPQGRLFGYTIFMESDSIMAINSITDMASLKAYAASIYDVVYPEDAGITDPRDRRNSLNRFVAYHLITKELGYDKIIDAYDTDHMLETKDMYEYLETMCPNTLIEVCKVRTPAETNLMNRNLDAGTVVRIIKSQSDIEAGNGVYHAVDNMLVYDINTHNMLSSKRLRFDSASFFDELTNNNMRGSGTTDPNLRFKLPRGYLKRVTCSEQTTVGYLTGYPKYQNYEGDEIFLRADISKLYDFVIETLPIPSGTYEVRFGYGANSNRGVAQLYFDGEPCGVPLNLSTLGDDPSIGYIEPETDEDDYYGYQNDKMMRNRGYMKAPAVFHVPVEGWFYGENSRYSANLLRRILGIYRFTEAGTHTLGVKGLSGGEFMFDYMEFIPTSALESEDIY